MGSSEKILSLEVNGKMQCHATRECQCAACTKKLSKATWTEF
jgi:hypothetical protein